MTLETPKKCDSDTPIDLPIDHVEKKSQPDPAHHLHHGSWRAPWNMAGKNRDERSRKLVFPPGEGWISSGTPESTEISSQVGRQPHQRVVERCWDTHCFLGWHVHVFRFRIRSDCPVWHLHKLHMGHETHWWTCRTTWAPRCCTSIYTHGIHGSISFVWRICFFSKVALQQPQDGNWKVITKDKHNVSGGG